jgi:tRNA-Thr(GGU) m(6)t(6)A37 methyltransferase TsaA
MIAGRALRDRSRPGDRPVTPSIDMSGDAGRPEFHVIGVGHVESVLTERAEAPRQADEAAPPAWLVFDPALAAAVADISAGDDIVVLTWLDRASRDVLRTRPRDDPQRAALGVFSTRSPDRPNPIGLHRAHVVAADGLRIRVEHLEALDGTPIIDVKPVLRDVDER